MFLSLRDASQELPQSNPERGSQFWLLIFFAGFLIPSSFNLTAFLI